MAARSAASAAPGSRLSPGGAPAAGADDRSGGWSLVALVAVAVVVRVLWLLTRVEVIENEGAEYARIAENLRQGDGYRGLSGATHLLFPPVYPLLAAAASYLAGGVELGARLVSLVMGSALVVPVHALVGRLYGRRVAVVAAGLVALHPVLVAMSASTFSEPTFLTLAAAGVYALVRAHQDGGLRWGVAAGALLALATLTRPEGAVYLVVLGGGALALGLARPGRRRDASVVTAGLVAAFAVVVAPYVAFVSSEVGELSPTGKTAINYTIAERMGRGLSYSEASHGIDRDLVVRGPLVDPGRFAGETVDTGPARLVGYVAGNASAQLRPLGRALLGSAPLGAPLVTAVALVGLLAGPWTRRRLAGEAVMVAAALTALAVLASVRWFQYRFLFPLLVLVLIWAARGLVVLTRWLPGAVERVRPRLVPLASRPGRALPLLVGIPVLALSLAGTAAGETGQKTFGQPGSPLAVDKRAGLWLRDRGGADATVMSLSAIVPFYAGATWRPLPYTDDPTVLLRWVDRHRPDFLVLTTDPARPAYVGRWAASGLPDPRYVPVHAARSGARALRVFRLTTGR